MPLSMYSYINLVAKFAHLKCNDLRKADGSAIVNTRRDSVNSADSRCKTNLVDRSKIISGPS